MFILGLTGSIGMGKTVAAGDFARLGVPVHDSDATVHDLMSKGGDAVTEVADTFPGVLAKGAIDRGLLGKKFYILRFGSVKLLFSAGMHVNGRARSFSTFLYYLRPVDKNVVMPLPL